MADWGQISFSEKTRKSINEPLCSCMYPGCTEKPIYSHVFQKKGVLKEISTNSKVFAFEYCDLYTFNRGECPVRYKESGINDTFGFFGFCNQHDNKLFELIEPPKGKYVDWYDEKNQYLLGYKTLCREIFVKLQLQRYFLKHLEGGYFSEGAYTNKANCDYSILILEKYKKILEKGILNSDYERYKFKITELPFRLDLCLASPIVIREECKGQYWGEDENVIPDTVNIINIFPYKERTVIIVGFLRGEKNIWATKLYSDLRSDDLEDVCKSLQDIMFRSEFHCMSKQLYTEIESEIPTFLNEWAELRDLHNYSLPYSSNIFRKYIMKQFGYTV